MAWSSESAPATSRCSRASRSGYSACCGSSASLGAAPKHSYRHLPRVGGRGGCWCWSRGVPTSGQHQHDDFPAPISDQHPRPAPMFPAPAFREVLFWIHPQTTQRKFRPLRTVPDSGAVRPGTGHRETNPVSGDSMPDRGKESTENLCGPSADGCKSEKGFSGQAGASRCPAAAAPSPDRA